MNRRQQLWEACRGGVAVSPRIIFPGLVLEEFLGDCPTCGRTRLQVTTTGVVSRHRAQVTTPRLPCPGSGEPSETGAYSDGSQYNKNLLQCGRCHRVVLEETTWPGAVPFHDRLKESK